jgi:hypothetical protein
VSDKPQTYQSYLLRLWPTTSQGGVTWRAMLEDPHTGERQGFASLEELFTYLKIRLAGPQTLSWEEPFTEVNSDLM